MQKIRSLIASSMALVLALSFGASASALAHQGQDDTTATNSSVSSSNSSNSTANTTTKAENHPNVKIDVLPAQTVTESQRQELHSRGDVIVKQLEKNHKNPKTDDQRKKVCESRKDGLNGKIFTLHKNSETIKTRIDTIYTKAQDYQKKNNLQPSGYADLIASADTAKAQAETANAVLHSVIPVITCDDTNTLSNLATYKAAAQQSRDSLKTYRTAVKAVLRSLEITKKSGGSTN